MNDFDKLKAYMGNRVKKKFKCGVEIDLAPLPGGFIGVIADIHKRNKGLIQRFNGDVEEASKHMDVGELEKLYNLLYTWLDMSVDDGRDEPDRELVLKTFIDNNLEELFEFMIELNGLDKKTLEEELIDELGNES